MYGYPQNPLAGLSQVGSQLSQIAMSPLQRWQQASLMHKIVALGAGAGLAYYLHKKGVEDLAVAGAGLATAYGASMVMHYPSMSRGVPTAAANGVASSALPPPSVDGMVANARAALGASFVGLPAARPSRQGQPVVTAAGVVTQPQPGSSKWDSLG